MPDNNPKLVVRPFVGRAPISAFESFYEWPDGKRTNFIYRDSEEAAREAWDGFTPAPGQPGPPRPSSS